MLLLVVEPRAQRLDLKQAYSKWPTILISVDAKLVVGTLVLVNLQQHHRHQIKL